MEKVNILVIGAGAVGLAACAYLSKNHSDVVLVEKEKSFGLRTSSCNSEVIHLGIYYLQNSLKHILCMRGNKLVKSISKYINIDPYYLHPDNSGIKPKLQGPNDCFADFYIKKEDNSFINLIGINFLGLTSSLAIEEYVAQLLKK